MRSPIRATSRSLGVYQRGLGAPWGRIVVDSTGRVGKSTGCPAGSETHRRGRATMASLRAQGRAYEIRECRSTERGPRQFVLARFRGVLTPEVLEQAEARAQRRFDRARLVASARRRGIPVSPHRTDAAARRLLAELRAGGSLDPGLVALLREALVMPP